MSSLLPKAAVCVAVNVTPPTVASPSQAFGSRHAATSSLSRCGSCARQSWGNLTGPGGVDVVGPSTFLAASRKLTLSPNVGKHAAHVDVRAWSRIVQLVVPDRDRDPSHIGGRGLQVEGHLLPPKSSFVTTVAPPRGHRTGSRRLTTRDGRHRSADRHLRLGIRWTHRGPRGHRSAAE